MLANLCTNDTIARTAVERIESLDAAERRAERSDRRRNVARYPLRDRLRDAEALNLPAIGIAD
jgi:hypothetical protein